MTAANKANGHFWETKALTEMNEEEWESICDLCGKCCVQSSSSLCHQLNVINSTCSVYSMRDQLVPHCPMLNPQNPEQISGMPATCSYRLLQEGKPLPDWHPLITGDPKSALNHKVIVQGKLNMEEAAPCPAPPEPTPEAILEIKTDITIDEELLKTAGAEKDNDNPFVLPEIRRSTFKTSGESFDPQEHARPKTSLTGKLLETSSHDIRTSLNGIVGMAQLIADTELTGEQRGCVDTIQQSTRALLKTLNYVLDISRIESGRMELSSDIMDLRALCKKMALAFKPQANAKTLELSCTCADNVPLSVLCDQNLLERVLTNLLNNAVEKTEQGSVQLSIECTGKGQHGAEFLISVTDTGAGISRELQDVILNKASDSQTPNSVVENAQSMGLTISRQLIEAMNGSMRINSQEESGTTVSIHLALQQANKPAPIKLAGVDQVKTIVRPDVQILLAEDNRVNRKTTTAILNKAGCKVDTAENGKLAVQMMESGDYDLVIMDCQMPIMDGYEATARIRELTEPDCYTPIIALTANAMAEDRQKCLDSGMNAYLAKPIARQDLIDLINKYTAE